MHVTKIKQSLKNWSKQRNKNFRDKKIWRQKICLKTACRLTCGWWCRWERWGAWAEDRAASCWPAPAQIWRPFFMQQSISKPPTDQSTNIWNWKCCHRERSRWECYKLTTDSLCKLWMEFTSHYWYFSIYNFSTMVISLIMLYILLWLLRYVPQLVSGAFKKSNNLGFLKASRQIDFFKTNY